MKKKDYFAPETTCVYVETESPLWAFTLLCRSKGDFDSLGMDFPMFPTSI